jgi:phosphohistidine phosphatase
MKLFLVRHADAIDYETESVQTDEHRYVTPGGRQTARKVFKKLREEFGNLDVIFTSPLTRAVQTAEILASGIKFTNDIEIAKELIVSATSSKILQLLKRNSTLHTIAFVGHEPTMSILITSISDNKQFNIPFAKAGVCLIDFDLNKEEGKFRWYFDPANFSFIK